METAPKHQLLEVTQEQMAKVREYLTIDVVTIREDLNAIEKWMKKESHLSEAYKYMDIRTIEKFYIIEKGSLENTKNRIDKLLTTRGLVSELCLNMSPDGFDDFLKYIHYLFLPKLHPVDLSRIRLTRLVSEEANNFNLLTLFRYSYLITDYTMNVDYNLGERYLLDLKNLTMSGLVKLLNPIVMKKGQTLSMEGYGIRIKGVHILHPPPFVDQILAIVKKVLKEKIFNRIFIHNTLEDLHKVIPKEILPQEYGGDLGDCATINDQWLTTLKTMEARQVIEKTNKLFSDESKRNSYKFNTEYMGLPGSFKQLVVD